MAIDLARRCDLPEMMDELDIDPAELRCALAEIRLVNRFLNGTRASLHHLSRLTGGIPVRRSLSVLDVGTGSADVPVAMSRWARRRGRSLRLFALDFHPRAIEAARAHIRGEPVQLLRADACRLPFADGSIDIVHCAMFLHHFDDARVVALLRDFDRIARVGVIINDLVRARPAYWGISFLSFLASPIFRNDARLSVRRAFRREEIESLARQAGLDYLRFRAHAGYRFCMSGSK